MTTSGDGQAAPNQLAVEHFREPVLGTDLHRPRLSWHLPSATTHQVAYRV